jgi:phosphotransferase system HPr (HPr) family protein
MADKGADNTLDRRRCDGGFEPGGPTVELQVEIRNSDGLHMRPAMQFVDMANTFDCIIEVSNGQISVDAKSIMQMSMLAATCGTRLVIKARGEDAQRAVGALRELVEEKMFDEPAAGAAGKA